MKTVAKLLIKNNEKYLMMYRSDHPTFGADPDLPGGTAEDDESALQTMLREVEEEVGYKVITNVHELFSGIGYSKNGTHYSLFVTEVTERPKITMSWEHSSYEWISRDEFISKALAAKDTYMHMVGEQLGLYANSKSS